LTLFLLILLQFIWQWSEMERNKTGGDWFMVNEQWDKMTAPEYMQFTRKWIGACHKSLKDTGSIYIACSYHNIGAKG